MGAVLSSSGGRSLGVKCLSDAKPGSLVKFGNGGTYYSGVWQAYSGMWGASIPTNSNMVYSVDLAYDPATFPNGVVFEWDIVPDYRYLGVEGFLALSYGNYDANSSPTQIPSRQAKNIVTLLASTSWTKTGSSPSAMLSECYLTTASIPVGGVSGSEPVAEVAFFPGNSANSLAFALGATQIGSFTDVNGVTWNVSQAISGVGTNKPYFVAIRPGGGDYFGALDYKAYFTFLQAQGKITGNEWFNGLGFGVEPYGQGAGKITIDTCSVVYN